MKIREESISGRRKALKWQACKPEQTWTTPGTEEGQHGRNVVFEEYRLKGVRLEITSCMAFKAWQGV